MADKHYKYVTLPFQAARIRPNTVLFSIGAEHIDDILADLEDSFQAVRRGGRV